MTGTRFRTLAGVTCALGFALGLNADSPRASGEKPGNAKGAATKPEDKRVTLAVAKDRANLMHSIYSATLDTMHHRYFRREQAVLPARAMEDVFAEIDRQSGIKTRWIAVNTPAMSVNHEPATDFEKKAAEEIAAGKPDYARVEKGYYQRAGAIPLAAGCVGCHTRFGMPNDKKPRFAALVISIPVKAE